MDVADVQAATIAAQFVDATHDDVQDAARLLGVDGNVEAARHLIARHLDRSGFVRRAYAPSAYPAEHRAIVEALVAVRGPATVDELAAHVPKRQARATNRPTDDAQIQAALDRDHESHVADLVDAAVRSGIVVRIIGHRHVVPRMREVERLIAFPDVQDWMRGPVCQCDGWDGRDTDHVRHVTVFMLANQAAERCS